MSQNPYSGAGAQFGGSGEGFDAQYGESRTSVMAIASLILGIISMLACCVGAIPGVPAAGLGIAAILAINANQSRLTGRGMAITGVVTGTIGLFLCVLMWAGGASAVRGLTHVVTGPLNGIENLDVRPLKEVLAPEAAAKLDEARLQAFRQAYQAKLGSFREVDHNPLRFAKLAISTYTDHDTQQVMEKTKQAPLAVWGKFDKGDAKIWFIVPQQARNSGPNKPDIFLDIVIFPEGSEPIYLMKDATDGTGATPPANTPDSSAPKTDAPAEPASPGSGG